MSGNRVCIERPQFNSNGILRIREIDDRVVLQAIKHRYFKAISTSIVVVGIVARTAVQRIIAARTVQDVVTAVAGNGVHLAIAGAIDVARPGQGQVFKVLAVDPEREGYRGYHAVYALSGNFNQCIAYIVDKVCVVAGTTNHCLLYTSDAADE